ncbi:MAG: hypothetical protein HC904_10135 [Blastochloris sp.]|nr:hypothetical protein [Blastochloris sp.]
MTSKQLADTQERLERATTEAAQLRTRVGELEKALTTAREGTSDEKNVQPHGGK